MGVGYMFEFKDFDYLTDGEIDLRIEQKLPANEEKGYVFLAIRSEYKISSISFGSNPPDFSIFIRFEWVLSSTGSVILSNVNISLTKASPNIPSFIRHEFESV